MLHTIEAIARRWGMDRREVLRLGTDPVAGLRFVVAVDKAPTVTLFEPGRKDINRLTNPLYAPEFKKTSGLFYVPAEAVAAILSTGVAELRNAIPGEWAHDTEILMLELQAGIISLTMFRPPIPVLAESLLVTEWGLSAFEAALPGLVTPAKPDPTHSQPAKIDHPQGRRKQQIAHLLQAIQAAGHDPLKIPYGGKNALMRHCCDKQPALFTESSFGHAWKEAKERGLIEVENPGQYRKPLI